MPQIFFSLIIFVCIIASWNIYHLLQELSVIKRKNKEEKERIRLKQEQELKEREEKERIRLKQEQELKEREEKFWGSTGVKHPYLRGLLLKEGKLLANIESGCLNEETINNFEEQIKEIRKEINNFCKENNLKVPGPKSLISQQIMHGLYWLK